MRIQNCPLADKVPESTDKGGVADVTKYFDDTIDTNRDTINTNHDTVDTITSEEGKLLKVILEHPDIILIL